MRGVIYGYLDDFQMSGGIWKNGRLFLEVADISVKRG
jgi:hypothetical protein